MIPFAFSLKELNKLDNYDTKLTDAHFGNSFLSFAIFNICVQMRSSCPSATALLPRLFAAALGSGRGADVCGVARGEEGASPREGEMPFICGGQ
jgi:hypothetical protein